MRHDETKEHLLHVIAAGRERGRTDRELHKQSRHYRAWPADVRDQMLRELAEAGRIRQVRSRGYSNRGRDRLAWVLTNTGDNKHA